MSPSSWKANLAALFIAQTCVMIAFSFVFPFIPLYVRALGVEDNAAAARWAGAIATAAAVTMSIAQPIWGSLADRYGRRLMVLRSILAASVTLALMGLAQAPWQLLVLRLLQGAFTGTLAAANALVATSVPRERLGSSLGLMQVALYSGMSVGPLVGGLIADQFGFRASCFVASGLMLVALCLVLALVREQFTPQSDAAPRPDILAGSRQLLAVRGLPVVLGVAFLIQYGHSAVSPVLALYIRELAEAKNAATVAGVILASTGVASAVAAVLVGRLGDSLGHRRVLHVCLVGAALTCVPQAFVKSPGELLAWRIALGLFLGGLMPSANALLAGLAPVEQRGAAFGLAGTSISLANAVGPISGALLAGALGMGSVFFASAALYVVGFLFVLARLRKATASAGEVPHHAVHPGPLE